jgi:hypothetical protein
MPIMRPLPPHFIVRAMVRARVPATSTVVRVFLIRLLQIRHRLVRR